MQTTGDGHMEVSSLRVVPMFMELDDATLAEVLARGDVVDVAGGGTIVAAGDKSSDLYVLVSGEAAVTVAVDDGADHVQVGVLHPGDTFGEVGALLRQPRTASVLATEDSTLLRVRAPVLDELLRAEGPFAGAFSRELARRLDTALGQRNELAVDALPDKVVVPAQDLSRMRSYMARYYLTAVRNVAKRHRLLTATERPRYETTFRLDDADRQRWLELFDVPAHVRRAPLTYYSTSGTMLLMQVVEDVGVNFRHLMHLRTEMTFDPDGRVVEPGVEYRLEGTLADIVALRDDRVALAIDATVRHPDGRVVQMNREHFVILHIDPESMEGLRSAPDFGHRDPAGLGELAKEPAQLTGTDAAAVAIEVPEDMGMRYGRLSGDLNMVHTTRRAARLFGHPRPFIQGLCTANYVIAALATADGTALRHLAVSFARRVFVGQRVELLMGDERVEVVDGDGKLLAFGTYRRAGAGG